MSGQSAKRGKTTVMASTGVSVIDALPPELLDTIFGFLDVRALCTARLVCTQFRSAASRCIHSVELSVETLRNRPETNLNSFQNLSRVSIIDVKDADVLVLAQSPVADAVTHVRAVQSLRPVPRRAGISAGSPLSPLPNLTSLTVRNADDLAPSFLATLRELFVEAPVSFRTANRAAVWLTNLTCLRINVQGMRKPFKAVTALTALQRLDIRGDLSHFPCVAELTLLTHLHFQDDHGPGSLSDLAPLASLSRLRRLVHLGVHHSGYEELGVSLERQVLASVSTFTCLRSLDLVCCQRPARSAFETVCMTPFSQLTALRLESSGLDASFLPRFSLERLQDLSLSDGVLLDRDGVAPLRRATGLTRLQLWSTSVGGTAGLEELGMALPRLSRLRALSLGTPDMWQALDLGTPDAEHVTFSLKAIAGLSELTRLELTGRGVTAPADVEVCLGLKKLRVLSISAPFSLALPSEFISPETAFAIAKLPELRKLSIIGDFGISRRDLTDHDAAGFNAERHDKGWPPLDLHISGF